MASITGQQWSAPTDWNTVCARATGRRRWHKTQKALAKARRILVAPRLLALQKKHLQQERGKPRPVVAWHPRGLIKQLAKEFKVSPQTMAKDVRIIERESLEAHDAARKPQPAWMQWARIKEARAPKVKPHWLHVRIPAELHAALQEATPDHERSALVRKALASYLETGTTHETEDCAGTVLMQVDPDTRDHLLRTAEQLHLPLVEVIASLLLTQFRRETPAA